MLKGVVFLDPSQVCQVSDLFFCCYFAENKKVKSLIILQRISVLLVVVLSFSHMRGDSAGLLFPAHAAVSGIKQWGDFNLHQTLIHKIQSKTNNKQAELR